MRATRLSWLRWQLSILDLPVTAAVIPLVLAFAAGTAVPVAASTGGEPHNACAEAIAVAERAKSIPAHLLAAIARAESGRYDAVSRQTRPWPWTVMAERKGRYFETKRQAIDTVRALQRRGVTNIDVGCMQINLRHHPDAFASLQQAFDPGANAAYAANFLAALHTETGSWEGAAGRYHSATPKYNRPYRQKIMRLWAEAQGRATPVVAEAEKTSEETPPDVAVIYGGQPSIDHRRVALLNANHRNAESEAVSGDTATREALRSRLPLVSIARSQAGRSVIRGGRHRLTPSTVDEDRFAARRREQLSRWRGRRAAPSPAVSVVRGASRE